MPSRSATRRSHAPAPAATLACGGAARGKRIIGPATQQRIRATLRSAVTSYMRQHPGILPANPAALLELPAGDRPGALAWILERVAA
jgi:hypothetical protein